MSRTGSRPWVQAEDVILELLRGRLRARMGVA